MTDSNFYLGRAYDPSKQAITEKEITYDPADLTTHAVVTGMTGSGKTGLCVILLEEAALKGIPAIIIDPKGDLTNLLLHFPDLAPQDFQPWLDADLARRAGKSLDQIAADASTSWREGLQDWGIPQERVLALKNAAQFAIFTPGSDAGIPVSVLSSLAAPEIPWKDNREVLREKITSTVTALLGLVGYTDIDPLRSREHILLANIFEAAWSQGKDVELAELILQTQTPPFDKLGAFPVETFFPAKDRMELAMVLNNILAAPAFETWREGQSLNIGSLLYTEAGRPRHNIFYLAHLSDAERMFFVTLLLSAVETWMRTQSGTGSLRALLYMDEIYGYLPPQRNPPSKQPLLRMLKNARAFGLGLLLATQNPVDVDYKALSNAGTWFIGKLQTEQDKNRLLDGLESAAGGIPRTIFDKLISSLGKRVFVLHNIHAKQPELLQTRWTMNFLAGPLMRNQIPALNRLANVDTSTPLSPSAVARISSPQGAQPMA
ncbi:MAG: ATP-binding protein, partial [Chloroflexi bacterium]